MLMDIPEVKRDMIRQQCYVSGGDIPQEYWNLYMYMYLTEHPSPTWKKVASALLFYSYFDELEVVQKKYLKGE